jgi:tetratricopeptide (TPR) repeat protein
MRRLGILLAVVVVVAQEAAAQSGQVERGVPGSAAAHSIRGRVFLPSGAPAEGPLRVTLRTSAQSVVSETFTDSVGNFEFRLVPNGNYEIVVWETNRFETTVERIEVFARSARTFTQNLFLREKQPESPARAKAGVVSARSLEGAIPKAARKAYEQGTKEARRGHAEKAVAHFQRALELHPDYLEALNDLGVQYMKLNRSADARAAFQRALEIDPRAPHPYVNIGVLHLHERAFAEAAACFERAVELDPGNWSSRMLLGLALFQMNELDRAQSEWEKALSLGEPPTVSIVRLHLANLFLRRRDLAKAIEQSEKYLKEVPDAANAGDVRERIAQMRRALRTPHR